MGWQRQSNGGSVQQAVEAALRQVLGGEAVRVDASGRTDAGVHARAQVVGFAAATPRTAQALQRGLDALLPSDISCLSVQPAP
ncbi:MAG: tRNA pseudouridine(38-40) synthase TruA, partial [Myxococcota bacterium]|nr:tRNA pseudouridine(38-40) synthase TruA [Myxococcota bacterium]